MSEQEPPRFKDDANAPRSLRTLFAAGAADLPSDAELQHLAGKLGPVLALPAAATVASGTATALKIGIAALALGGGALLVSSLGGGQKSAQPSTMPTANAVHVLPPASPASEAKEAPPESAPPTPSAPANEGASAPEPTAKSTAQAQPAESEATFLERARAALTTSPARALTLANQHRSRYPSGVLAQEREVIAIEALKRLGRTDEAARRAGEFSTRYPGSAYGRKLDAGAGK